MTNPPRLDDGDALAGFRLKRLEVYNWGTFDGRVWTLDAQGKATVGVENRWAEAKSPLQLILQASLQESGGRPITRRLVQPVWPAERLPGLLPKNKK